MNRASLLKDWGLSLYASTDRRLLRRSVARSASLLLAQPPDYRPPPPNFEARTSGFKRPFGFINGPGTLHTSAEFRLAKQLLTVRGKISIVPPQ